MSRREKFRLHETSPVQLALYLLLRVVVMVVSMFPYSQARSISKLLARVILLIDRKHRRIAEKNLANSADVCPPSEIPAFIQRVYNHVGLGFVEMLMIPRLLAQRQISRYVKLVRWDIFNRCLSEGRGVIAVIGHLGNWEIGGLAAGLEGYFLHPLARPLANTRIDQYLMRFRSLTGQTVIPRDRALGEMVRVLRQNKILIIQVDQDARHAGVQVNFFGRPASTHRAPAILSLKYRAPIVLANVYREGSVNYAVLSEPIYPDAYVGLPDGVKALTQAYTDRIEQFIRQHPDQWFWMHDRWKSAERSARLAAATL